MSEPIDNLQIHIEAKATNANKQLSDTINLLTKLKTKLSGIDMDKLSMHKSIKVDIDKSSLAKLKKTTGNIKKSFGDVGKDFVFKGNSKQLEATIGKLQEKIIGLREKQKKYDALGTDKTSKGYKNLLYDITLATNKLDVLKRKQEAMSNAKPISFYDKPNWYENLQANGGSTTTEPQTTVTKTKPSVANNRPASSAMEYNQSEISEFIDNFANRNVKASKAAEQLNDSLKKITPTANKLKSATTELNNKTTKLVPQATKGKLLSLSSGIKSLQKEISKCCNGISKFGKAIKTNAFSGLQKHLGKVGFNLKMIGMQLKFMLFGKVFTSLFEQMKDGFNDLAIWSDKSGTAFNKNISLMYSNMKLLGRSLATAFEPLINVATPYINVFIGKLVELSNKVAQLFASLTGSNTWTKATFQANNYAESVDDSVDSTKGLAKAQRDLMGFDEINKLSDKSSSTSSGKNVSADGSEAFETKDVSNDISKMADKIKKAWQKSDFTDIGKIIAKKLNRALSSIDWSAANSGAKKLAKSLATLINGFVANANWNNVGSTIAKSLNTAILGIDTFLTTTNWNNVGKALASSLNGFMKDFTFSGLGKTIGDSVNAAASTAYNFVSNVDWGKLGENIVTSINKFFETVDFTTVGKTIGSAISGACAFVKDFVSNADIKQIAKDLGDLLSGIWKEIDVGDVAPVIAGLIGAKLSIKGTTKLLKSATSGLKDKFATAIGDAFIGKGALKSIGTKLKPLGSKIFNALVTGLKGLGKFVTKIPSMLATVASTLVGQIAICIGTAIAGFKFGNWLYDHTKIGEWADAIVETVGDFLTKTIPDLQAKILAWVTTAVNGLKDKVKGLFNSLFGIGTDDETYTKTVNVDVNSSNYDTKVQEVKNAVDKNVNIKAKTTDSYKKAVGNAGKGITTTVTLKPATAMSDLAKKWASDFQKYWKPTWNLNIKGQDGTVTQTTNSAYWVPAKKDGGMFKNGKWNNIAKYAQGGLPNSGQLFAAREAGPELVGKIGNSTAVVNNDQIVASVADGVYKAVVGAMSVVGQRNNNIALDATLIVGGKEITDVVIKEVKQRTKASGFNPIA